MYDYLEELERFNKTNFCLLTLSISDELKRQLELDDKKVSEDDFNNMCEMIYHFYQLTDYEENLHLLVIRYVELMKVKNYCDIEYYDILHF